MSESDLDPVHWKDASGSVSDTTSAPRALWLAITRERSVVIASVALLATLGALLWTTREAQTDLVRTTALQEARAIANSLMDFRELYTSEVTGRVRSHGIEVTHEYATRDRAIPLPATLTMQLADRWAERGGEGAVRLYSDYPFPWRADAGGGPRDDFEWEALRYLRRDSTKPYFRWETHDGRPVLRYAAADVMQESCVGCHNSHPDSPKRNWKTGDLRGALAVSLPLGAAMAQADRSLAGIFALIALLGVGGLGVLGLTARRLRGQVRDALRSAQRLGSYTLEEKISEGGMGEVYRARHAMLRRPTAVKVLRRDRMDEQAIQRFEREVQLTSELTHPNTISIYDYGTTAQGDFYYAMEYLDGVSLERLVEQTGALPDTRVVHILRQICASLEEAHLEGLMHRDIKPANIMLCRQGSREDVVKVLDFGLVKRTGLEGSTTRLTSVETLTGTPRFMSPEAVSSPEEVGPGSDLYQVALVGYYLVTGEYAFDGASVVEVCYQHMNVEPIAPSERLGRPICEDLERVLLWALAKKPQDRPASARAMADELAGCSAADRWHRSDAELWWADHEAVRTRPSPEHPLQGHEKSRIRLDLDTRR